LGIASRALRLLTKQALWQHVLIIPAKCNPINYSVEQGELSRCCGETDRLLDGCTVTAIISSVAIAGRAYLDFPYVFV
jgi:hypothetical protein